MRLQREATIALEYDLIVALARAPHPADAGVGADRLEVGELGIDHPSVALHGDADDRILPDGSIMAIERRDRPGR